ncbi:MAG: MFS family permease/Dipeptide/tripeptide permease [Chloroflexi bacterium]|nr:MAG: MFS family permease/Dipeptide/tripeptide permease [Chloroflexota bacterium]
MSGATITPALPAMVAHFSDVPNVEILVRLVVTMPALFIVIGAPVAGYIADRWGRKRLLAYSTILFGIGGSSGLAMDSLYSVLAGRAVLGLAVAGVITASTTLIADYYTGPSRARLMGLQAAFISLGAFVFILAGGALADISWRGPFFVYLTAFLFVPLIAVALYEPIRTPVGPAPSPEITGNPAPPSLTLPPPRFPLRALSLIFGLSLVNQMVFYLVPVQIPFYLRELNESTGAQIGLAIAAITIFGALTSFQYRRISGRIGVVGTVILANIVMGIGYIAVGLASTYGLVVLGLAIAGLGLGLQMANMNTWAAAITPQRFRGRALGGVATFMFMGHFLSPAASQPLVLAYGYPMAFGMAGGLLLFVAIVFLIARPWITAPGSERGR